MSNQSKRDFLGIFLSVTCGIHCLVTPFLILTFPSIAKAITSPWLHTALIFIMFIVFKASVLNSYKLHKCKKTLGFGIAGFTLILITYFNEVFNHEGHDHHGHHEHEHGHVESSGEHIESAASHVEAGGHDETYMLIIAVVGAILLITSHIMNIRKSKCLREGKVCN